MGGMEAPGAPEVARIPGVIVPSVNVLVCVVKGVGEPRVRQRPRVWMRPRV